MLTDYGKSLAKLRPDNRWGTEHQSSDEPFDLLLRVSTKYSATKHESEAVAETYLLTFWQGHNILVTMWCLPGTQDSVVQDVKARTRAEPEVVPIEA